MRLNYVKVNVGNDVSKSWALFGMCTNIDFCHNYIMDLLGGNRFYTTLQKVADLQRIFIPAHANEWCPQTLCMVAQMTSSKEHGICSQRELGSNSELVSS